MIVLPPKVTAEMIIADVKAMMRAAPTRELVISDRVAQIVSPARLAAETGLKVTVST